MMDGGDEEQSHFGFTKGNPHPAYTAGGGIGGGPLGSGCGAGSGLGSGGGTGGGAPAAGLGEAGRANPIAGGNPSMTSTPVSSGGGLGNPQAASDLLHLVGSSPDGGGANPALLAAPLGLAGLGPAALGALKAKDATAAAAEEGDDE